MFKSHLLVFLMLGILSSCQKTDTSNPSDTKEVQQRTNFEGEVFDFNKTELFYYPKFESGALFVGNAQGQLITIVRLEGFFTGDASFVNGYVKIGDNFVEVVSENHPPAYFIFDSFFEEYNLHVTPNPDAIFANHGYGIVMNNGIPEHMGKPFEEVLQLRDPDGGDIYSLNVPCTGSANVKKHCISGGCGISSCEMGDSWSIATISSAFNCRVTCSDGFWSCCTNKGCSCFKDACCSEKD